MRGKTWGVMSVGNKERAKMFSTYCQSSSERELRCSSIRAKALAEDKSSFRHVRRVCLKFSLAGFWGVW